MRLLPEGETWLEDVNWNADGLVAAIAQEVGSGRVLTLAWMNREALMETARSQRAVYWSRSRGKLWRKGEESGHVQEVQSIRLDCDADAIVMLVKQVGGIACHTGRHSCFYRELSADGWQAKEPVLKNPADIYSS